MRFLLIPLLVLGACQPQAAAPVPLEASVLRSDVAYLTSDLLEGRALGTRGRDSAAAFLARRFYVLGLKPIFPAACAERDSCGQTFFQTFSTADYGGINVAAVVPGSDPELRHEYVVIGAHYDHLGVNMTHARDAPHVGLRRGADDNASGTAAVLELARMFSAVPPRRSVLFVAFDAEEVGLYGSRAFVDQPPVPIASIVAMLDLDMVGRLRQDRLWVLGEETAPRFASILERANEPLGLEVVSKPIDFSPAAYTGVSDQLSFHRKGIPVLHFFTGMHVDYHRRSDRVEQINFAGMLRVIALAERVVRELADTTGKPSGTAPFRDSGLGADRRGVRPHAVRP